MAGLVPKTWKDQRLARIENCLDQWQPLEKLYTYSFRKFISKGTLLLKSSLFLKDWQEALVDYGVNLGIDFDRPTGI